MSVGLSTMLRPLRDIPDSVVGKSERKWDVYRFGPVSGLVPTIADWPIGGDPFFCEVGGRAYYLDVCENDAALSDKMCSTALAHRFRGDAQTARRVSTGVN